MRVRHGRRWRKRVLREAIVVNVAWPSKIGEPWYLVAEHPEVPPGMVLVEDKPRYYTEVYPPDEAFT